MIKVLKCLASINCLSVGLRFPGCFNLEKGLTFVRRTRNSGGIVNQINYILMSYLQSTDIATPQGPVFVEELQEGNQLQAASLNGHVFSWQTRTVRMDMGVSESMAAWIHFNNGRVMVTGLNQLFLLNTGQLMKAKDLAAGTSRLMDQNGNPVDLTEVSIGACRGAFYGVAADAPYAGNMDGHLLLSNGVITGDLILEMNAEDLFAKGMLAKPQNAQKI